METNTALNVNPKVFSRYSLLLKKGDLPDFIENFEKTGLANMGVEIVHQPSASLRKRIDIEFITENKSADVALKQELADNHSLSPWTRRVVSLQ